MVESAAPDDIGSRVRASASRLFTRLNPGDGDESSDPDHAALAIYDWEIADDTGLELEVVRSALQALNGEWVVLKVHNGEHRITGLTEP